MAHYHGFHGGYGGGGGGGGGMGGFGAGFLGVAMLPYRLAMVGMLLNRSVDRRTARRHARRHERTRRATQPYRQRRQAPPAGSAGLALPLAIAAQPHGPRAPSPEHKRLEALRPQAAELRKRIRQSYGPVTSAGAGVAFTAPIAPALYEQWTGEPLPQGVARPARSPSPSPSPSGPPGRAARQSVPTLDQQLVDDLDGALTSLGYKPAAKRKAAITACVQPGDTVEAALPRLLQHLSPVQKQRP